jgi:hypothetical protein
MSEEPEQVLVQQRVAALGRIKEMRAHEPIEDQHAADEHDCRHCEDDGE